MPETAASVQVDDSPMKSEAKLVLPETVPTAPLAVQVVEPPSTTEAGEHESDSAEADAVATEARDSAPARARTASRDRRDRARRTGTSFQEIGRASANRTGGRDYFACYRQIAGRLQPGARQDRARRPLRPW